jgi:hypothetical protein
MNHEPLGLLDRPIKSGDDSESEGRMCPKLATETAASACANNITAGSDTQDVP